VPAQQLRAAAGMFLDWFRICLKHRYLSRLRPNHDPTLPPEGARKRRSGWGHLKLILAVREDQVSTFPTGPLPSATDSRSTTASRGKRDP
jgi:hypothetical protein